MKNIVICFIIFNFISSLKPLCQETSILKRHIGINAFSYRYVGKDENGLDFGDRLCILDGISYKRDYDHFTSRFSFGYDRLMREIKWTGPDSYSGNIICSVFSIATGIQKNHSYKKLSLFYGIDLLDNPIIHKIDLNGGIDGEGQHEKIYENWIGISPLLGFQYDITSKFSLSIESSYTLATIIMSADYYDERENFRHYLNPINAFSVYYNF